VEKCRGPGRTEHALLQTETTGLAFHRSAVEILVLNELLIAALDLIRRHVWNVDRLIQFPAACDMHITRPSPMRGRSYDDAGTE
jgi:hypothetical protein